MGKNGSRKFVRVAGVGALVVASMAGCGGGGGGGFDVDKFADSLSKEGAFTKDQAKCIGEYIDENGSDELKKSLDEGEATSVDDPEVADEFAQLMGTGGAECLLS